MFHRQVTRPINRTPRSNPKFNTNHLKSQKRSEIHHSNQLRKQDLENQEIEAAINAAYGARSHQTQWDIEKEKRSDQNLKEHHKVKYFAKKFASVVVPALIVTNIAMGMVNSVNGEQEDLEDRVNDPNVEDTRQGIVPKSNPLIQPLSTTGEGLIGDIDEYSVDGNNYVITEFEPEDSDEYIAIVNISDPENIEVEDGFKMEEIKDFDFDPEEKDLFFTAKDDNNHKLYHFKVKGDTLEYVRNVDIEETLRDVVCFKDKIYLGNSSGPNRLFERSTLEMTDERLTTKYIEINGEILEYAHMGLWTSTLYRTNRNMERLKQIPVSFEGITSPFIDFTTYGNKMALSVSYNFDNGTTILLEDNGTAINVLTEIDDGVMNVLVSEDELITTEFAAFGGSFGNVYNKMWNIKNLDFVYKTKSYVDEEGRLMLFNSKYNSTLGFGLGKDSKGLSAMKIDRPDYSNIFHINSIELYPFTENDLLNIFKHMFNENVENPSTEIHDLLKGTFHGGGEQPIISLYDNDNKEVIQNYSIKINENGTWEREVKYGAINLNYASALAEVFGGFGLTEAIKYGLINYNFSYIKSHYGPRGHLHKEFSGLKANTFMEKMTDVEFKLEGSYQQYIASPAHGEFKHKDGTLFGLLNGSRVNPFPNSTYVSPEGRFMFTWEKLKHMKIVGHGEGGDYRASVRGPDVSEDYYGTIMPEEVIWAYGEPPIPPKDRDNSGVVIQPWQIGTMIGVAATAIGGLFARHSNKKHKKPQIHLQSQIQAIQPQVPVQQPQTQYYQQQQVPAQQYYQSPGHAPGATSPAASQLPQYQQPPMQQMPMQNIPQQPQIPSQQPHIPTQQQIQIQSRPFIPHQEMQQMPTQPIPEPPQIGNIPLEFYQRKQD